MQTPFAYFLAVLALVGLPATGCTIKGTINQITDTTSNVTGTTSGAAWWNEDGQIKPDVKAAAFAAANGRNLERDIAAGGGEYLTSMSLLLRVPEDQRPAFFSTAQARYAQAPGERAKDPERWHLFLQNAAVAPR
ncbi:MAG TPA: DUF3015 family protein [Nitrospira sp.]|nr:DUF3015 family protein [Nitrospira sp.]